MLTIQIDSREKSKAITKIIADFDKNGVKHYVSKLFVGDYMSLDNPRLVIDRKQNLQELCTNVSTVPKKEKNGRYKRNEQGQIMSGWLRFTNELQRAKDAGIKVIILCEHGGNINHLDDVKRWENPRIKESPLAMSGERLHKVLCSMSKHYGVTFLFCNKKNTGTEIIRLLEGEGTADE